MTTNSADNTRPSPKVLNLLIKLKNTGKADATIKSTNAILRIISRHADLDNPEQVKQYIANRTGSNTYKHNLCKTYARYCRFARALPHR